MHKLIANSQQLIVSRKPRGSYQLSATSYKLHRGVSLLDALMGAALLALVFTGFLATLQFAVRAATDSKARAGAVTLAQAKIEYLRSIPYDEVGFTWADTNRGHGSDDDGYDDDHPGYGGVLSDEYDLIAVKYEQITLNNIVYERRTLVAFVDDQADGQNEYDSNFITDDYKVAKVSILWATRGITHSVDMQTNIVPEGTEQ